MTSFSFCDFETQRKEVLDFENFKLQIRAGKHRAVGIFHAWAQKNVKDY